MESGLPARYALRMSDSSFMDHVPSHEREKRRKRLRSFEEYEHSRENVKGPQEMAKEMQRSEKLAELNFAMESEPKTHENVKKQVEKDIAEKGIEHILEHAPSAESKKALEKGKFIVQVSSHPKTHEDALVAVPEGNVQEKLPIKPSFSDKYVSQFLGKAS
jgi:hypothetical protein